MQCLSSGPESYFEFVLFNCLLISTVTHAYHMITAAPFFIFSQSFHSLALHNPLPLLHLILLQLILHLIILPILHPILHPILRLLPILHLLPFTLLPLTPHSAHSLLLLSECAPPEKRFHFH